jgi:pimeloyl-ACP methyl ester carboxylesterase
MVRDRLSLEIWCDDLMEILRDAGCESVVAVGHSLGAQVALRLAWCHPTAVRGLALLDPVVPEALAGKLRSLKRTAPLVRLALQAARLANRLGLYRRRIADRDLGDLDREAREILRSPEGREALVARYGSPWLGLRHTPTASYLQQLLEMVRPLPPLEAIDRPTLVLQSTGLAMHEADLFRAAVERLPRVEIQPIDATHWPLTESPDQVRRALERWLADPKRF